MLGWPRIRSGLAALVGAGLWVFPLVASSHREAPFITEHPKIDGTDFYMFRSYEAGRAGFVTLIANYAPLQDSYGGPNYFFMDPEAIYEIHIDNDGNGVEDLTFQFQFVNSFRNTTLAIGTKQIAIPLLVSGVVTEANDLDANLLETYQIKVIRGDRRTGVAQQVTKSSGSATFEKPLDNIGDKTFAGAYTGYADSHIHSIFVPGCGNGKVFVGQRQDSFPVNLGEIFDLVNISNPVGDQNRDAETSDTAQKSVTTLALELPTSCLVAPGGNGIIGGWTTASLRQARVLAPCPNPVAGKPPAVEGGAFVQLSRLGMPLVNEVVIGLKDKDKFNASEPKGDAQFLDYVTHPTLPEILKILFALTPPPVPRTDLVQVFLTGVPGLNENGSTCEMLRLNTAAPAGIPPGAGAQNDLGVLGGDTHGFPNGRRPGDDVVDIALRVVIGELIDAAAAPDLTDGTRLPANTFREQFPYLNTPRRGAKQP